MHSNLQDLRYKNRGIRFYLIAKKRQASTIRVALLKVGATIKWTKR